MGSGEQGRAFIHVNDIVNALVLALDKGWGHGWIQIGPSYCTSIKEIAYKVAEISGKVLCQGLTPQNRKVTKLVVLIIRKQRNSWMGAICFLGRRFERILSLD